MLHGDYRSSVSKGGPRALTFVPSSVPKVLANCPSCIARYTVAQVLGDDYTGGADSGEGGQPLPMGWYELQTEVDIYWQQVNPEDACNVDPYYTGLALRAGGCAIFYVSAGDRDGIIVINFCAAPDASASCGGTPSGYARVNRRDTTVPVSVTGENAELVLPAPSKACE